MDTLAPAESVDLSSVPKIKTYLRLLGIDPSGVAIQRGAKNYAGPNCPGASWNCTTSRMVVQLSLSVASNGDDDDDNENRFVCRRDRGAGTVTKDDSPPVQSCFILQGGSSNSATCHIETYGSTGTISQTCFITQGGASNRAFAKLVAGMGSNGGDQNILQRIEIRQTGGSSGNTLNASETALLGIAGGGGGLPREAFQDFQQVICGNQQASGTGFNTATVKQQGAAAAHFSNAGDVRIEQNRDSESSTCTAGTATTPGAAPFADIPGVFPLHDPVSCPVASDSFGSPKLEANTCSRIQQDAASGRNRVTRQDQTNLLFASVNGAANVDIEQGTFDGGIDSTQDQGSSGVSSIVDVQDVDQIALVRNATGFVDIVEIEDPRCCAGGHQLGNASNTWSLGQDLTQRAFVDGELLDPDNESDPNVFIAQAGSDYGNCTTDGNCTVNQRVSNNVETRTQSDSGMTVDIFFDCTAGSFGESLRIAGTAGILLEGSTCFTQDDVG